MNILIFARDVMYSPLGVEALNRFLYLVAEYFQLALEFGFHTNRRHATPRQFSIHSAFFATLPVRAL